MYSVSDDDMLIIILLVPVIIGVSFCFCCCCCNGEGFIAIGILKVVASFVIMGIDFPFFQFGPAVFIAGVIWIMSGINTKRARLAAMKEEGNRRAISHDTVNSAQAVVHNTEETEAHLVLKPVVVADDPQTDPSNVIYARIVPPVELPGAGITCCGDLDMVAPSSNLQSFEIDDNQEDNLERGMEKQVEKFQDTN